MNFLNEFNMPSCGLRTCTKCSVPVLPKDIQTQVYNEYLNSSFPDVLDPAKALLRIKYVLEDIMESMNAGGTCHCHQDGTETLVDGPDIQNALFHLFNSVKNILICSGINVWEYNDTLFLEGAQIDDSSIWAEDQLDHFLADDVPDEDE